MSSFVKPWKSFEEQLHQLKERGLEVERDAEALSSLQRIGYYRLSGYWYPFRKPSRDEHGKPCRLDEFVEGSRFEDVLSLYVFDKRLRLLALDALERIEVALRVDIAYLLGKSDPFAHENPACFHGKFSKRIKPPHSSTEHQKWLEKYERQLKVSRRVPFVEHYRQKYGRLPIWVAIEVWDFGMMSSLYAGLKKKDQDWIASKYGLTSGSLLAQWLQSLNFIRNVSAHHSRLWNVNVLIRSDLPNILNGWPQLNTSRSFFYFCLIQYLMKIICPNSSWGERFSGLLGEFPEPESGAIRLMDFGAFKDWQDWGLWKTD